MRRSKAEVERYISSVQNSSPSQKERPMKGFLFAKLYCEAKEYDLAKRHVSEYLKVQERDPKAHKFLGQLYEREGDIDKAVGCYKRSLDMNPAQKDLVLKVAELLCSKGEDDSRAEFWVEKASKMLPGTPAVFNLKERLLSRRGQQGWNQLFDLLQAELAVRPSDAHVNMKLVQLYTSDGRQEEAVRHCLNTENKGLLRQNLDWYNTVVHTLQEYLYQPSVMSNEKMCRQLQKELLLAHCNLLRLTLSGKGVQPSVDALRSFDCAMQALSKTSGSVTDELSEMFAEMRGHLYLHAGTLLLKMAQEKLQQWRNVVDLAGLCYLLAYQVPRPKARVSKGDQSVPSHLELLSSERQSQSGHMLLNLSTDPHTFVREVVETFGNRSGQGCLFELLFGPQAPAGTSFIGNDDIRSINTQSPDLADLDKCDKESILLHGGDLQQLCWLGLQWYFLGQRLPLGPWLRQLFPRLTLETSKLDTNTPESICLLDLEVFVCGVVFCSHTQLQESARISSSGQQQQLLKEPRCLPLPLLLLLSTDRQREWWDAVYSLIHKQAAPGMSAKLRAIVQHGLSTLRAGEKHGLQPALPIHWAQHLSQTGVGVNSYYDQHEYIGRSVHYWKVVLPLLDMIKRRRSIPEPLQPLFMHFRSKDIEISAVKSYEEEARVAFATHLDIEGKTEEAIASLESINNISSNWHLAQIFQRLSDEAGNGVEETQDRCITYLRKFKTYLSKIYSANADDMDKLPVSMEEVMDLLNDVNQQLRDSGEAIDEEDMNGLPALSSPSHLTETVATISHTKLSPSPSKGIVSPSKRHLISPKAPPPWVEDQKALIQKLCQQVEALKNEVHDLKLNSSENSASPQHRMYRDSYGAEGLQESYPPSQTFHGAPLTVSTTGPSAYYNQSPAYNSQYLLRTAANVTPTKAPMYGINCLPPQQRMYTYQQPTHTPPLQTTPACIYPPQDQVFGAPLRFESPATSLLSPYSEEYYGHGVTQPTTNPPLPEPGYFTKPSVVPPQPPKSIEGKPMDFGKISFGQQPPTETPKVPSFGAGVIAQSTPSAAFKFNSNFKSNDGDFTFTSEAKNESLLRLLTSDLPAKTDAAPENKQPAMEQPGSQGGIFTFGSKNTSGFSFADAAQGSSGLFGKTEQPFSFSDVAKPIFGQPNTAQEEKAAESDNESAHVEEDEDGPHFEPIVPLPDKVDVKTGEEEEEEMFCNRAKLFRFDADTKEWKERGLGNLKILKHTTSGKVRLLMRREQVLKICANHYITADMLLKPNAGSDKSWVWNAVDYAEEVPKPEQLAIRFKTADEASLFRTKFEEAQKIVPASPEKRDQFEKKEAAQKPPAPQTTSFGFQFVKKDGEWDCDVCCVRNAAAAVQCVACQSANPNAPSKSDSSSTNEAKTLTGGVASVGGFTFGFAADSSKSTSSSSSKGFGAFGASIPSSFTFGTSSSATPAPFGVTSSSATPAPFGATSSSATSALFGATSSSATPAPFGVTSSSATPAPFGVTSSSATPAPFGATSSSATSALFGATSSSATPAPFGVTSSSATPAPFGATSSSATPAAFVTTDSSNAFPSLSGASSSSSPATFGSQFAKKFGQWDCDTCAVRNEASSNSCVSCQSPNPSVKPAATVTSTKSATPPLVTGFGAQFTKKDGQWDCDTCAVRNEASANSCVSCQTPNPSAKPPASEPAASFGSGFGALFVKKDGQWDCDTCAVRNEASSNSCVSCQSPNPSVKPAATVTSTKSATPPLVTGFGAQITKKAGQWDCDACLVRNDVSASHCVSCQTPNPSAKPPASVPAASFGSGFGAQFNKKDGQWDCDTCLVRNEVSASHCASCQTANPNPTLAAMFAKKENEWDCDTCLVRNKASAGQCVSCQTPNPNAKSTVTAAPSSSSFSFSFGAKSSSSQPAETGFKASFASASAFKFGTSEDKISAASFKFEVPPSTENNPPTTAGFSFTGPIPASGFKFGSQETPQETPAADAASQGSGSASMFLKNIAEQHREKEKESAVTVSASETFVNKTDQDDNPLFTGKPDTFTFADLSKSSQGDFQFGQTDPNFKGFMRAGEQLFSSLQTSQKPETSADQDEEDMYKTEENDDIQFEPVVQMPDKVDLVTGEEDEQALYSQRVKLFRFDPTTSQWKERGVGILKFLKNASNGRLRVLMRREQVLKVCANHWITTTMNLKPLSGSDKAWMWLANDFSDGDARLEQLAAKFKTPELAEEFKVKFEECQRLLLDIPLQTPHKLVDTGRTAQLIKKAEEMKSGLKDLKSFLTDDKTKIKDNDSQAGDTTATNISSLIIKPHADSTGPTLEWDNYDLREEALDDSVDTSVYASPVASSPIRKNLFRFGESAAGFSFCFQPVVSPSKSPTKLNQSGVSGTDDEHDVTQEEERDGQYFEPVVPLPDLINTSTGEENEQVLFSHRAKLYRYDKDLKQWKERGIGDLKLLQNYDTKRVRLVMRRDQVLKICANHWINSTMKLEPMKGAEKAWVWSALDFTEGDGKVEQLAVRFKLQDVANTFRDVFDEAKDAQEKDIMVTPVMSAEATPPVTATGTTTPLCGQAAISVLEETTRERTELSPEAFYTPDSKTSTASLFSLPKNVVSPPKFVFGTHTLQKIFGSPTSSSETEGSSASSKPRDSGPDPPTSSATPAFKIPEKAPPQDESSSVASDPEVEVVYAREPTAEQAALARELQLPLTFFCYQNEPGYISDDQTDDEDFETAVKALNGRLYPEPVQGISAISSSQAEASRVDPDCEVVWEKKPTPEEEQRAKCLLLPPTFFCGVGSDNEADKDKAEDFETEVRKAQDALYPQRSTDAAPSSETTDQMASSEETDTSTTEEQIPDQSAQIRASSSSPIDLSTKKTEDNPETHTSSAPADSPPDLVDSPPHLAESTSAPAVSNSAPAESTAPEVSPLAPAESPPTESTPAPEVSHPAPAESPPAESTPAPEVSPLALADSTPTPDVSPPAPAKSTSAPEVSLPAPTESTPAPEVSPPAPTESTPAPEVSPPAPTDSTPAPADSAQAASTPAPEVSAPADSTPAPDVSAPAPEVSTPAPSTYSPAAADSTTVSTNFTTTTAVTTTQDMPSFGFITTGGGFSFADLAKNTGEFAFGQSDSNFSWTGAGATVFGVAPAPKKDGEEAGSDEDDAADNADIHFEPIVSLPEVETKSGEEDEEILFKERTKLYRWDRDLNQWKERGVGDIKILFHPEKRFYRVLMRREQVLRVCANHTISLAMDLKPMNTSAQALVWTATDYAEGEGKVEQLAAKFKTPELAESFRKTFTECQSRMGQSDSMAVTSPQMCRAQEHSRASNPRVYLTIAADDETLGTIVVELFSHIVPKTAENFRVLCTGQKGFGLRDSIFHRVIPDFMCQGGDITNQDGTGGKSIYGGKFEDENFDVRHTGPGLLSMANRGRDTNNSQFFITLKKAEHLDFKHVAFGFVQEGMETVRQMGELGSKTGKPAKKIVITDCGQL